MELNSLSLSLFSLHSSSRTPLAYLEKLEKHLSDYRSGHGNLPSEAPQEISRQIYASSSFLASTDPKASRAFSGYLTAFSYTQRARFVNGVNSAAEAVETINSLHKVA